VAAEGQDRALSASQLTALPTVEDLPRARDGLSESAVREAFDAFRRHAAQLQAQLRVLQAAGSRTGGGEPSGHAVRMDALHLIRAAAEFADTIEQDAQTASAAQLARLEQEITRRNRDLTEREHEVDGLRQDTERQRADTLGTARNEARELVTKAKADAARELKEAEARGAKLLEQARHQATELTNSARAEVEQTLDWARDQARAVLGRAQHGAEQLLTAAGMGPEKVAEVAAAIVRSMEPPQEDAPDEPEAAAEPAEEEPEPEAEPESSEPSEPQP
jgi:cell division septum initiation protein DivIVA